MNLGIALFALSFIIASNLAIAEDYFPENLISVTSVKIVSINATLSGKQNFSCKNASEKGKYDSNAKVFHVPTRSSKCATTIEFYRADQYFLETNSIPVSFNSGRGGHLVLKIPVYVDSGIFQPHLKASITSIPLWCSISKTETSKIGKTLNFFEAELMDEKTTELDCEIGNYSDSTQNTGTARISIIETI